MAPVRRSGMPQVGHPHERRDEQKRDSQTSAYMGDVAQLPSHTCIPMHPERDVQKYKCLLKDQRDEEISGAWSHVVGTVSG
jgi:hypothetical protein